MVQDADRCIEGLRMMHADDAVLFRGAFGAGSLHADTSPERPGPAGGGTKPAETRDQQCSGICSGSYCLQRRSSSTQRCLITWS